MKKNTYTKRMLVRELSFSTGITQKSARFVLEALCYIAYRETADQGFTIPGICRLDIIRRKERKMRNPQTGENILIAEHDALRVRALKKARTAIAPPPANLITTVNPLAAEAGAAPADAPNMAEDYSKAVSFCCATCGQEIEAPLSAVGIQAECPACNAQILIPAQSEPGTLHGPALPEPALVPIAPPVSPSSPGDSQPREAAEGASIATPPVSAPTPSDAQPAAAATPSSLPTDQAKLKNQTIRIDLAALGLDTGGTPALQKTLPRKRMLSFFCKNCNQEIEAPADMAGSASECPACGASFEVPFFSDLGTLHGSDLEHKKDEAAIKDMKSRTIRIEVPDDF